MKIVIGSVRTEFDGWIHTQENKLDLLDSNSFDRIFSDKSAKCFLAEHVWEHPTFIEGIIAARNCFTYS